VSKKTIMIVGNGDIDPAKAAIIDAADQVVRFNDCRSAGPGGVKTDIVAVCNTGRPAKAMTEDTIWRNRACVQAASEIWCVRDGAKFEALRPGLLARHPDLEDFCDDYSEGYRQIAEAEGKVLHVISPRVHESVDDALAPFQPGDYAVPSSGLIVIADILHHYAKPEDEVVIAGFGHVGWELHPFPAEKRLVESWIDKGLLRRL
jgi:hypothetical protein